MQRRVTNTEVAQAPGSHTEGLVDKDVSLESSGQCKESDAR
jgi:hypothetical protein